MIKDYFEESISVKKSILDDRNLLSLIDKAIDLLKEVFASGKKAMIAGNGGSAADAQHMAGEIVGKYKKERKGYPALALNVNTSILTAWSNDYDFKTVFERQIEAFGRPGDVFIGISTSIHSICEEIEKGFESN
ncbi:MAG: SIS domain-containing protein [Candidatus Wolfebacteria bacterium]|nr:SIS domain-containing protein [Candidatus Wolfebacteria bacterium]